ncbi:MAG: amidohydrolase family protein [Chloroflexi bacterium]|nr:amidohydrolase family protein [Chloroflexota bacterium]MDA1271956.1 amidohydrolase family protein [Chloroflexota bacterium]
MATQTPTIDVQVHAYERNHPGRPWSGFLQGPDEVTGDDMVAAMDAVGVDGALLISPFSLYRYDASYALEVYAAHPDRFALIKPFDPASESVADEVADWAATPGVAGARIMLTAQEYTADDPGLNRIFAAGAQAGIPINVMCSGKLQLMGELARRNPDTQIVVDHVGLVQPFEPPPPPEPFADLANVLALAAYDNVAIKISGAGTLSHQPFPYPDIWEPLSKVFDAFGLDRCMWGTDWTRAVLLLNYEQGVEAFRVTDQLSDAERSVLMGGSLQKIYNWSPGAR